MEFGWTDEQQRWWDDVVAFARRELNDALVARDRDATFPVENWKQCADFGIQGSFIPEAYGGRGLDMLTTIHLLEGLGYGCEDNGLTLALNGQMWSVQEPLLRFGTEAQKQKYLTGLCAGDMFGAHGMTEPESGSDAYSLQTQAERRDGGYVLNGQKTLVGLAPVASIALVFAKTNPAAGRWGISAFIIEAGTPGFTVSPPKDKMGLRTVPLGDLFLEDCFIPEENRLGPEGAGASIFNSAMEWERSFIFASHVGAMARQLEKTIAYACQREQYGQPIGKFQSVSNRIANMKVRLETARHFLYKAAWLLDNDQPAMMEAAMAKLVLSEAFVESSLDAIRLHGGKGYLADCGVERELRDAVGGVIYSGTSDIQRNLIAGLLGL
ncbi:MAG: acyl-CoA dehydrogenase [Chloroflexi bacterium]|nr:acyl-CoA dehydrogenase [Chloroflexota bacterium]